jgi:hypothetical protein
MEDEVIYNYDNNPNTRQDGLLIILLQMAVVAILTLGFIAMRAVVEGL